MAYSVVRIDEIEPSGPGGAVRFVRRELGVEAFGVNWTAGTIFRFGPEATRQPVAGPEGFTMIAIGTPRGSYEPRGPF
jgi:hypothetical protein